MAKYLSVCLPEEMVEEILSRLPPKPLMRFKCLSKSWYNLINSSSFVAKNLSYSKNNTSMSCILFQRTVLKDKTIKDKNEISSILRKNNDDTKDIVLSLVTLSTHDDDDQNSFGCVVDDFPLPSPMCFYSLVGHCDGIVCLTTFDYGKDGIILCNPAIKEGFEYLPKSCLLLPPKHPDDFDNEDDYHDALESTSAGVGFGYDSKANVYKVVRIVSLLTAYNVTRRAEVFTVGSASWREIKFDKEVYVSWDPSLNICFKGICYFDAFIIDTMSIEILLAFDMSGAIS